MTESLRALGGAAEPPPAASLTDRLRRARFLTRMEPGAIQRLGPWPLITDLPVEEHEALDPLAEGVIAAYGERFGLEPPPARSPEVVVLFRRAEEYRLFSELGSEAAGLELEGHAGGGLAVLHLERAAEEGASLLVHELVHLLNRRTFGGELPPWLEEGLAVELASHRLDEAGRPQPGTLWGERVVRERGLRLGMGGTRLEEEIELTGALAALGRLAKLTEEGRLPPVSALFDLTPDRFVLRPLQTIQRVATETAIENSISVFHIEGDETKGRIIGREGRNIRALEAATGMKRWQISLGQPLRSAPARNYAQAGPRMCKARVGRCYPAITCER